jgi:ZIP family zinc transporter
MPILLAVLTVVSTGLGGLVALKARDRMHLILGASGGVLLGLVAFDLIPEVFELSDATAFGVPSVMVAFVVGFLGLHVLERSAGVHEPPDSDYGAHAHAHARIGWLGSGGLVLHSFFDGVAIGLGFQVSEGVGLAVAFAVLTHDFADGLNTVSIMLRHGHERKNAIRMLAADAVAPILGVLSTFLFTLPDGSLALYLGAFAGFLTYLAAADILPEAHSRHPSRMTLLATIAGVLVMWFVIGTVG